MVELRRCNDYKGIFAKVGGIGYQEDLNMDADRQNKI
jgi:hypothetical protein